MTMAGIGTEKEREKGKDRNGVEILVHTSAPCGGKDDSHYRALASAYLLFEPAKRLNFDDDNLDKYSSAPEILGERYSCDSFQDLAPREVLRHRDPQMVISPDYDDICDVSKIDHRTLARNQTTRSILNLSLESPQASFVSVLDNLDSPALKRSREFTNTPPPSAKRKITQLESEKEESWETPPSVIPDSQSPYSRMLPELSSPTKILELYIQHFDTSRSILTATDNDEPSQPPAAFSMNISFDSLQPVASSPPQETPSLFPTGTDESTQIILDTPSGEPQRKPQSPKLLKTKIRPLPTPSAYSRAGYDSTTTRLGRLQVSPPSPMKQPIQSSPRPTPSASPSQKRRKTEIYATPAKQPQSKASPTKNLSKPTNHLQPRVTPYQIHPPPPRTSSWGSRPPQIITPALYHLAVQLELPHRFRPVSQTRPLRELERGYWAIATASWPHPMRDQAWAALGAYVGQGKAGWGVWGVRCFMADAVEDGRGECGGGEQTGWRVYCWGGVAGHVYLLLYLVSQRRVKGTGAKWIDGSGEVTLRMS